MKSTILAEYFRQPHALTLEQMQQIQEQMLSEIGNDEDAKELYDDLIEKAIRYTKIRAEWALMGREEKIEADAGRTAAHDRVITAFDMLARYLRKKGCPADWRDVLGDLDADPSFRKRIGDMANYLVFTTAISQR